MLNHLNDLAYQVIKVIYSSNQFAHACIDVKECQGRITLLGIVETEEDRMIAERRTRAMSGVVEVVNKIRIYKKDTGQLIMP